jgi:hypothetical protein
MKEVEDGKAVSVMRPHNTNIMYHVRINNRLGDTWRAGARVI